MPTGRTPQQSRQLPGLACEECRKRKLRCDRQRPQCRLCNELGIVCELNLARPPRGPKKGYSRNSQAKKSTASTNSSGQVPDISSSESSVQTDGDDNSMGFESQDRLESCHLPHISRIMQAELHHLYFDRIHALVPMLQQQRYCTWATLDTKSEEQQCLQYAMWTLATTVTKQFDSIRESLYNATRTLAHRLETKNRQLSNVPIELAQIWVLLTVYEFMQRDYQQGWMSAGHTFRLVQLMRLHEIDRPLGIGSCQMPSSSSIVSTSTASYNSVSSDIPTLGYSPDWVPKEEMRRTFWMAYCLDRFPSMCNNLPLTFNEQTICCRLPMPEEAFQNSQLVIECFHSEGLTLTGTAAANLSYMSQFILLATACGRTIAHGQQSAVEQTYGDTPQGFIDRHEWLDTLLSQRLQAISPISRPRDPLFFFSHMMAQCTILKLYKVLQSNFSSLNDSDSKMLLEYRQRAIAAADKIVGYAGHLDQFNLFKVHPFTPFTIYLCADFFLSNINIDPVFEIHYLEMTQVLCDLSSMNHLAEYCTDLLTSESTMSEFGQWKPEKTDVIDIMDSVPLLEMDDCQFTTEDLKAFEAFASSLN